MNRALAILFLLASCLVLHAENYYFTTNGNDANDGMSWETSWTNLQGKVQEITTGTNTFNVGAGTWQMTNTHLTISKNMTTIKGVDRETVILMAAETNRVIYANNVTCILDSVTITGGLLTNRASKESGAGVYSLTKVGIMTNCIVRGNTNGTGAVYNQGGGGVANMDIFNSIVESNYCNGNGGGIMYGTVRDSIVRGNRSDYRGGGVSFSTVYGCKIYDNYGELFYGGGEGNFYNSIISNNAVNLVDGLYAGAYAYQGSNCIFTENRGYRGVVGGAMTNCIVSNNVAAIDVAFVTQLDGCTVVGNTSGKGSILSSTYATNSIIINNTATNGYIFSGRYYASGCIAVSNTVKAVANGMDLIVNCTIVGNSIGAGFRTLQMSATGIAANNIVYANSTNAISGSTNLYSNLIGVNPLFLPDTYKIQQASPAVDAGNDTYSTTPLDFYGRARIYGARVDIGAVEWRPTDSPIEPTVQSRKFAMMRFME